MPDGDRPSDRPTPPHIFEEEIPTLVTCLACGGNWEKKYETATGHGRSICRWWTNGSMSSEQIDKWRNRKPPSP